ncbi:hypothetical protein K449DRAFT_397210 [Hypoxylon sp. EC38]|nr:hypothetical protein K449DRAFT_397210 [Hypoxylon sp. EC38]
MASIRDLLAPADNRNGKLETKEKGEAARVDTTLGTTDFTVEFILDVLCPWCYIGLKNLNNAITAYKDRHPGATFEVICSPFLLDPLAPRSAYDKPTYLNAPKYSIDQWAVLGETVGIKFSWKGRTGNTRDAHKLLRFALESTPTTAPSTAFAKQRSPNRNPSLNQGAASAAPEIAPTSPPPQTDPPPAPSTSHSNPTRGPALQLRVLEALFKWHHELDGDLSDRRALAATVAAVTGFSAVDLLAVCESEEWGRAVDELFLDVTSPHGRRGLNVRAVPTFIVNDRETFGVQCYRNALHIVVVKVPYTESADEIWVYVLSRG